MHSLNHHRIFAEPEGVRAIVAPEVGCTGQPNFDPIRVGKDAWRDLKQDGHETLDRWILLGTAIAVGRAQALAEARANKPSGYRYNKAFGAWLRANQFDDMDKGTRSRLLKCIDNLPAIEMWLDSLGPAERANYTHPKALLEAWTKAAATPKAAAAGVAGLAANAPNPVLDPATVAEAFLAFTPDERAECATAVGYVAWIEACPPSDSADGNGQKIKTGKHNATVVKLLNAAFGQLALGDKDKTLEALTAVTQVLKRQNSTPHNLIFAVGKKLVGPSWDSRKS